MRPSVASLALNEVSPTVFCPSAPLFLLDGESIDRVKNAAARAPLGRARFCAHDSAAATVQEMLVVQTAASYVRPHRHIAKSESLLLLEGELEALFFNDDGTVSSRHRMRAYGNGGPFYYRIPPSTWHSIFIVSPSIVMQEVTQGPFRSQDGEFASWSPTVDDHAGVAVFLDALRVGYPA